MTREEHEKVINSIKEKLGDDSTGLIADDIGLLISDNMAMNETIGKKETEITRLKNDKDLLIKTNGNLLLQVGMGEEEQEVKPEQEIKKEAFSFKSIFDEKGNFKQ